MDSQLKAEELSSLILAASAPAEISAACAAVEDFIRKLVADQMRSFFSSAFPVLICKVFGFEDASRRSAAPTGWIDRALAANDAELARKVFHLLSPSGVLLTSVLSVDRHFLVKYVFPVERLPEYVKCVLQSEKDCRLLGDLCPLFKNRVKKDLVRGTYQVQLTVFEYYMFWFAYYPVCKGNGESTTDDAVLRRKRKFRFENWTCSLQALSSTSRCSGQKTESNLYTRLLYAYLREFVPSIDANAYQPYRSSLLHYSTGNEVVRLQAEFVAYTLIHFWLVDNDFSPFPVNVCRSFGISFPYRNALGETPPTAGLGEVVKVFLKYLNSSSLAENKATGTAGDFRGSQGWRDSNLVNAVKSSLSCGDSVSSWNSIIRRPLYRFILRTFLFCPVEASMKNVSQVFSSWITYIEPWKTYSQNFWEFDAWDDQLSESAKCKKEKVQPDSNYSPCWQDYVISNCLFYSSLVVHFLGFAHKLLHTNAETIIGMTLKVLSVLTSSKELVDTLKKVDAAYRSKSTGSSSAILDGFFKHVPSIREQLQDWEDGLCESEADGTFLHDNWNRDLKLFSEGEDGGHQLLQLFILRAEAEIYALAGDNLADNLKALGSLKLQMSCLFGNSNTGNPGVATAERLHNQPCLKELFTPKHPRIGRQQWDDIKYKGDWMRRPISESEVAWLARLLVRISDWLNATLGLDQRQNNHAIPSSSWAYLDMHKRDSDHEGGLREALWMVVQSLLSWILMLGQMVLQFMREHNLRINLRMLASKKVVTLLVLCTIVCSFRRAFGLRLRPPVVLMSMFW